MAIRIFSLKKSEQTNNNPFIEIDGVELIKEDISKKAALKQNKLCSWAVNEQGNAYLLDDNVDKIYLNKTA